MNKDYDVLKLPIVYSPNRLFALHQDAGDCFRFAAARVRSMRFGGRRRARRERKRRQR